MTILLSASFQEISITTNTIQIDIINLRIRVLHTLMPRKAHHTVSCDPERAFGAVKRKDI